MPNKKKKLYNLITGKDKKRERVAQKMAERRKNYEQAVKSGGKDAPVQSTKRTKMKF